MKLINWLSNMTAQAVPSLEGYAEGGGYAPQINHLPTLSGSLLLHTPPLRGTPLKRGRGGSQL